MKKVFRVIFWIFSGFLALMALALLSQSTLSCALLLGCAVLLNPIFLEKAPIKKGLTALLSIGLFIAAIAVFPPTVEPAARAEQEVEIASRQAPQAVKEAVETAPNKQSELKLLDDVEAQKEQESVTVTPTPTQKPTPTLKPTPTPTLRPTPTQEPTKAPTAQPTIATKQAPPPAPITRSIGITILEYTDVVKRGSFASIKIQGAPNTDYTCEVEYKSGMSSADGLGTKRSDANGIVSWRWKVGTRTSLNYTPSIYIDGWGDSISVDFEVTDYKDLCF